MGMNKTKQEKQRTISQWLDLINGLIPHGDIIELPVLSGSMSPLIMPGFTIFIRACSAHEVRTGDIIVFKEVNSLTTHRVLIRIHFGRCSILYQKGDANRFGKWIRTDRVVGVVDSIKNNSGTRTILSDKAEIAKAKRESFRQTGLTAWNVALIIPRFIKQCLREKRTNSD